LDARDVLPFYLRDVRGSVLLAQTPDVVAVITPGLLHRDLLLDRRDFQRDFFSTVAYSDSGLDA